MRKQWSTSLSVALPIISPKHNTDWGLLAVIKGPHTGKLVWQIHYFTLDRQSWLITEAVKNGGITGKDELVGESLEIFVRTLFVCGRQQKLKNGEEK